MEVLVQLPFYFLQGALDGFGVIASYSYIDSTTPIKDVAGRTLPLPGLSPNNVNFVGYYEKGPISVRLAYNWRDDYLIGLSAAATGIYNSPVHGPVGDAALRLLAECFVGPRGEQPPRREAAYL